ncbi:hypothetical protein FA15DRAFT_589620 [Coprinopsis marcescibilis]|uniref:F-box domain-containing protein n=1 Tax=Coprinopsis marcescibilis TaxID=230819 RepID=A0A5C3L1C1_COPMA|nr:hypothetical protein FA15DRAFT_589620 [Coprinopsis marcescibilis]
MDSEHTVVLPLLVAQICTRWRQTAFATPRLWARLFLQLSPDHTALLAIVNTWLVRSGGCPLTVYVFWEEPPFAARHPILDALLAHSERWQSMFFYMPYTAFKSLTHIRKRLPQLTSLSLGTKDEPPSSELVGKLDVFADAPQLRSLECVNFSPLIFKFPWGHLTEVPMMAVTVDEFVDILLQTSKLQKGGFVFMDGASRSRSRYLAPSPQLSVYHNHRIHLCHPSLRSFTIMTPPFNSHVDLRFLFPQLSFPQLEELVICNLNSEFCDEFVGFLGRLPCLRVLHLRKTALGDWQLVQGLRKCVMLESLIVYSAPGQAPTVTHHLLEALTWRRGDRARQKNLLPCLKMLELTVDYNVSDDFVRMVRSRVVFVGDLPPADELGPFVPTLPARLEKLRIRPTEDLGDRVYTGLAEIASCGVDVSVEDLI